MISGISQHEDTIIPGLNWFYSKGWTPHKFQLDAWVAYLDGKSGLLNAPTGSGKTYALWIPTILEFLRNFFMFLYKQLGHLT